MYILVSIELSQNNIGGSIVISYNSAFLNRPHFSYCNFYFNIGIQNIELDSYQLYINHTQSSIT